MDVFRPRIDALSASVARFKALSAPHKGWVRNEYDGSVSVEIQGDRYSVEEWFTRIDQRRFIEVDRVDRQELDVIPDERSFGVRF